MNLRKREIKLFIVVILFFLCPLVQSQNNDKGYIFPFNTTDKEINQSSSQYDLVNQLLQIAFLKSKDSSIKMNESFLGTGFHLEENIRQNWDGVNWIDNWRYAYTYDANDNITELLYERWDGSYWVGFFRIANIYDENDNNIQWVYSNWDGSNWVPNGMSTCRYDENDNKIEDVFLRWDGSNWVPSTMHTYAWDDKKMIEDVREMWNGNNWVLAQKNTYTYDEKNMIEDLSQLWSGYWIDERKYTYTYDENDNRIESLQQVWYISYWANVSRHLYQYDGKKMIEDLSQDVDVSDWVNKSKKTYAYDENNEMIEYLYEEWSGSVWVNISKNLYSYDGKDNMIVDLLQDWINSDWVDVRMHTYTYDQYNNKTEDLSQNWNGSNWVSIERDIYNYSSAPEITRPIEGGILISGQEDTIRWVGGIEGSFIKIKYSADGGSNFELIDTGISATDSMYIWDIPNNLFIPKSIIRIEREEYFEILAESDTFKIKPLIITKLDDNGNYISYDSTDWWGFSNNDLDVWPESWWQNFDYTGIDPITNRIYSPWQGDSVFAKASSSDHPDWMSFVSAFGVNACYAFGYPGLYCSKALLLWAALKDDWEGSCFGIAISNALAFEKKADFLQAYPSFPNFTEPFLVLSDTSIIKVVNELFTHQFGNPHNLYYEKTPNETLNDLRELLKEDKVPIRALSFCSNDPFDPGGHTVVGYKIEKDTSFDFIHYIYVYDNSYPNVLDARVKINTLTNFGFGSWSTQYAWQNWGGNKDIFLEDSAKTFLSKPLLPKKSKGMSLFVLSENDLQILPSTQTTPLITDSQGNQTGIGSLGMVVAIPGSYPLIKKNGNSGPPYGYSFPTDNYSVVMTNFIADTIDCYLFTGSKSFLYERYGATQTQTDRLFFDGGVSVTNPDPEQKTVKLLSIISDTTSADEKLFLFRSINLSQNDSVKITNPDDNKLDLISYGSQKNYQIELNYASSTGFGRFLNTGITLSQNTTHKLVPNWGDFADLGLTIYVDEGNDGMIDDTLEIQNQVTGIGEEQGSLIPTEYRLEQNYPNPFNNSTIIRYSIPKEGIVTLKIYNAIGEEVTTLVNEVKQPGNYEATFGTEKFTSGVYFYRIQAGSFVQTRKMILLK